MPNVYSGNIETNELEPEQEIGRGAWSEHLYQAFFLTTFVKTQGNNDSPKSITQGNFCQKTQRTGSIFSTATKNSKNW